MMNSRFHKMTALVGLALCLVCMNAAAVRGQDSAYVWLEFGTRDTIFSKVGDPVYFDVVVRLGFFSSKAERGTRVEVNPFVDSVMSISPPITRLPLAPENFLVECTAQREPDAASTFFHKRPMELFVTPRDRFTNPVTDSIDISLQVNFPLEFSGAPGHPDPPFAVRQRIRGEQAFYFVPDVARVRGERSGYVITAYCPDDFRIIGRCDSFFVTPHPPVLCENDDVVL